MLVLHLHCLQPQNVDNRVDQTRLCSGIYLGYCTRRFDRIFVGILLLLLKKRQHSADQRTSYYAHIWRHWGLDPDRRLVGPDQH